MEGGSPRPPCQPGSFVPNLLQLRVQWMLHRPGSRRFSHSLARPWAATARLQAITTQAEDNLVDAAIARP